MIFQFYWVFLWFWKPRQYNVFDFYHKKVLWALGCQGLEVHGGHRGMGQSASAVWFMAVQRRANITIFNMVPVLISQNFQETAEPSPLGGAKPCFVLVWSVLQRAQILENDDWTVNGMSKKKCQTDLSRILKVWQANMARENKPCLVFMLLGSVVSH